MLDPDVVLTAFVQALQSIEELIVEMGGKKNVADNITGHYFSSGTENSIIKSVLQMENPSILVAYDTLLGGNFNGESVWKHRFNVYVRGANRQVGSYDSLNPPATITHLWWLMMNRPVLNSAAPNIRYIELCGGNLDIMETPTMQMKVDEMGSDYLFGVCVFAEKGDSQ